MNSENLKNNLNSEREILPADEQKICDLIGRLDSVECPKNFDFRLKARIASADKSDYQPSVWQTLRYVVPVAACVLVVAFVMVRAGMFSSTANQTGDTIASAANPNIQPFDERSGETKIFTVSNTTAPEIAAVPNRNGSTNNIPNMDVSLKSPSENRNLSSPKSSKEAESTMSRVLGVGQNRKPLVPKEFDQESNKKSLIKETLDFIGLETEMSGGKLKIINIRENTVADKSGFRIGDLIESVGDTKIIQGETMLKSNNVGKITVLRDGKIIGIALKPN